MSPPLLHIHPLSPISPQYLSLSLSELSTQSLIVLKLWYCKCPHCFKGKNVLTPPNLPHPQTPKPSPPNKNRVQIFHLNNPECTHHSELFRAQRRSTVTGVQGSHSYFIQYTNITQSVHTPLYPFSPPPSTVPVTIALQRSGSKCHLVLAAEHKLHSLSSVSSVNMLYRWQYCVQLHFVQIT